MYWNEKEHPDNGSNTPNQGNYTNTDYTRPEYYGQQGVQAASSPQPVQPLEQYNPYAEYPAYDHYEAPAAPTPQMGEYRGPHMLEGYTVDAGEEQRDAAAHGSAQEQGKKRRKGLAGLGGIGAAIGALLLKFPALAFILKFGFAGITALISVAIYATFLGWPFAIGLVILLFIHEMGHALVMKLKGIPVGGLIFIPLLGAAVTMRQMPQNARDEAEVGIAGPIAGAIASSVCLLIARSSPIADPLWAALAYFGFFINLINLVPVLPFDGGRVLAAIDRRLWILGFVALLALQVWQWVNGNTSFWLLLFILLAATQLFSRGLNARGAQERAYYNVPMMTRIVMSLLYFGLIAVLYLGMTMAHGLMPML